MKLEGASAIVTGAASGLGFETASMLARAGAHVVLVDLPGPRGEEAAQQLGGTAVFSPADVTDEDAVAAAVEAASSAGPLRVVVNCAGVVNAARTVGRDGPLPLAEFERVLRINTVGSFNVIRLAAPIMAETEVCDDGDRGVIVSTASVAAFDGQIGQAAYAASKGAIHSMTLPLAREFSRFAIRVVAIAPGIMGTPMMAGLPDEAQASLGQQVPHPPRLGRPDEFAALVRHITENTYLNGETIRLDGALRMAPK